MKATTILDKTKSRLKQLDSFRAAWTAYRSQQLKAKYRGRRSAYYNASVTEDFIYNREAVIAAIRKRLNMRRRKPPAKQVGGVHTFAFIPSIDWHSHLLPDLEALGSVSHFDYARLGYQLDEFRSNTPEGRQRREQMNRRAINQLVETHRHSPVDWIFIYANGYEISPGTVEEMTARCGIPTVNMCLDDKQSWDGPSVGGHRAGQIDICSAFDISWSSARVACEWYIAEGARPIYMPEGCDTTTYHSYTERQDIDVSFIGAAYGFRQSLLRRLAEDGVRVRAFGPGWPDGPVRGCAAAQVMSRSRINLGMGGIGYASDLTNVKTRDFEVPAVGGGVYLTSFNADLAQQFHIGHEILCYQAYDDLIEQIRYYLVRPAEAAAIAAAGQRRAISEHRWLNRYVELLRILEVL